MKPWVFITTGVVALLASTGLIAYGCMSDDDGDSPQAIADGSDTVSEPADDTAEVDSDK